MTLRRGDCARCTERITGTGIVYKADGDDIGDPEGTRSFYGEARTSSGTTVLLEVRFRGSRVLSQVQFREIERSRVVFRGRVLRQAFVGTEDGWVFDFRTQDTAEPGRTITSTLGRIRLIGPPEREDVAAVNGAVEVQGGCGGDDIEVVAVEAPDPSNPGVTPPPPPPPPLPPPSAPPPSSPTVTTTVDDDADSGCSGDTVEEDDGGGCSGDSSDEDTGGGCSGDDGTDDSGGGCEGDSGDTGGGGCGGDGGGGGCDGGDAAGGCSGCGGGSAASAGLTTRAMARTWRLVWPIGLVGGVNRWMRRRCRRRSTNAS